MNRKLSALMSLVLGATLLVGAGCEDEAGKAALNTCNKAPERTEELGRSKTSMNQMKADLAQAQAKVQELTKENEQLKNPKTARQRHLPPRSLPLQPRRSKQVGQPNGKDAYTKISIGSAIAGIIASYTHNIRMSVGHTFLRRYLV